nr:MiaB/RimO family radical SAM methylthiotransferase [Clostridia bacterium]
MQRTVGLISLGCAKNRVDSEQMLGLLGQGSYALVNDPSEAEILIVNTCGFIESAKEEAIDTLLEMAQYKKTGRCRLLVATGCLVQRYGADLKEQMPEIDVLLGVGEYPRLLDALEQGLDGKRPMYCGRTQEVFSGPRVLTTPGYSAYVRIGDGCDNRCSYCAIPIIRGGYRSRSMESVLSEAELLAGQGVRELTYIAQDTTRFGDDMPPHAGRLPELIRRTCAIEGLEWVRVLYCYPSRVNDALLEALARESKACPYLDLPLQHIDADLLRAMNRQGSPEAIRSLLHRARSMGLTLRTTLIVGF